MLVRMYVCIYVSMYVWHRHSSVPQSLTCEYAMYASVLVRMYASVLSVLIGACTHVRMYVCIYVNMLVRMYVFIGAAVSSIVGIGAAGKLLHDVALPAFPLPTRGYCDLDQPELQMLAAFVVPVCRLEAEPPLSAAGTDRGTVVQVVVPGTQDAAAKSGGTGRKSDADKSGGGTGRKSDADSRQGGRGFRRPADPVASAAAWPSGSGLTRAAGGVGSGIGAAGVADHVD